LGAGGVRLLIDECLSPRIAEWLNETGEHDAVHPLHVGRRGERDDTVLARCIQEDRILVTQDAQDFRGLIGRESLHPGLIILPIADRDGTYRLLMHAIDLLSAQGNPADLMVNHVLEVAADGEGALYELPPRTDV
jgi:predicted nuclease of predicted toxin-antitoxin system